MKAILLAHTGAPAVLEYVDVPTPTAGAGEVLVKADTIGVSQAETMLRAGTYPWMPPLPVIPGIEMAGTVAALGAGVTTFALGDKVFVSARELPQRAGCYAEYITVPANALRPLPPTPTWRRQPACPTTRWPTTWFMSRRAECPASPH